MSRVLSRYTEQSVMSSPGRHAARVAELPRDLGELVQCIQQLVVYDVVAPEFYGFTVPRQREKEIHLRSMERKLDRLLALRDAPLIEPRPVEQRLVGRCGHFTLFLVAALRSQGIPARARCGFGSYFNPPFFEDHWVCEYWNESMNRWMLADPQFDAVWRGQLGIDHNILDVPRDRFLVAGEAWARCRDGVLDPARFGIHFVGLRGLWYVAGNVIRDLAALNRMELLPWDTWGGMPQVDHRLNDDQLAFFDDVAEMSRNPDSNSESLDRLYREDERIRVPRTVFNSLLNRPEAI